MAQGLRRQFVPEPETSPGFPITEFIPAPQRSQGHGAQTMEKPKYLVEFLGGPMDGYREMSPVLPSRFPLQLPVYVSTSWFAPSPCVQKPGDSPVTSVAIYMQTKRANRWTYHFIKSVSLAEFESLEDLSKTDNILRR